MTQIGHLFIQKMENKKSVRNASRSDAGGEKKSWSAVSLAWELGYLIMVPLVVLALLGRFSDKKLGTSPWLLLTGVVASITISSFLVYKKTLDIIDKK